MKNLFILFLISITISSCSVFYGSNYNNTKKIKNLEIGMSKDEVMNIMGNDYIVESTTQEKDGLLEIIKYYAPSDVSYYIHLLNGKLVMFNRSYPPVSPSQSITIENRDNTGN